VFSMRRPYLRLRRAWERLRNVYPTLSFERRPGDAETITATAGTLQTSGWMLTGDGMTDPFVSPIFGPTRGASEEEKASLQKMVEDVPVAVFQALNRKLNERGLCLSIELLTHTP
jgi:hypothetical protein